MKRWILAPFVTLIGWCGFGATPAEFAIRNAQAEIAQHAGYFAGYNHLAMAYTRRARETGDASYYAKADEMVNKSLALSPDNYDARKVRVAVLLGRREWAAALESARKLNKETPDDVAVYGYIADADIALGNYKDAVQQAQWMLNLRAANPEGMIRAGLLREIYKDWNGSLEMLQMALEATPFAESEDRAWILVQMARVELESGDAKTAEATANEALALFPEYHLARAELKEISGGPER